MAGHTTKKKTAKKRASKKTPGLTTGPKPKPARPTKGSRIVPHTFFPSRRGTPRGKAVRARPQAISALTQTQIQDTLATAKAKKLPAGRVAALRKELRRR